MCIHAHFIHRIEPFGVNAGYYFSGDGAWAGQMQPAAADKDGSTGLVPAPLTGQNDSYLRGDGKWIQANNAPTAAQYWFGTANGTSPTYNYNASNTTLFTVTLSAGTAIKQISPGTFSLAAGSTYKCCCVITANPNMNTNTIYGWMANNADVGVQAQTHSYTTTDANNMQAVAYVVATDVVTIYVRAYYFSGQADLAKTWCTIEVVSNNNTITQFTGATAIADGAVGYIPKPLTGQQNYVLTGGGTWSPVSSYLAAVTLADQNAVAFSSIPSSATEITVLFRSVSIPFDTSDFVVQLGYGTAPTYVDSGYTGAATIVQAAYPSVTYIYTTGFGIWANQKVTVFTGVMTITLFDAATNTWISSLTGTVSLNNVLVATISNAHISLPGPATALRVLASAKTPSYKFGGGAINVRYTR